MGPHTSVKIFGGMRPFYRRTEANPGLLFMLRTTSGHFDSTAPQETGTRGRRLGSFRCAVSTKDSRLRPRWRRALLRLARYINSSEESSSSALRNYAPARQRRHEIAASSLSDADIDDAKRHVAHREIKATHKQGQWTFRTIRVLLARCARHSGSRGFHIAKPPLDLFNWIRERLEKRKRKPHLYVHFNLSQMVWCIASGGKEVAQIMFWADINHDDSKETLVITGAYPKGTKPQLNEIDKILVPPNKLVKTQIAAFVLPIRAEKGRP